MRERERERERERDARVRREKNKESEREFLSLPNDLTDMADYAEKKKKKKKKKKKTKRKKKKENALSHARRVLVRLRHYVLSLSLSLFSNLMRASGELCYHARVV